jgi:glycosyltransferase involved in cell wall biosynthesis
MRIGLIAPPWLPVPPTAYGGIEAVLDTLALALQATGHDVVLAASGDSTCPVRRVPGFPPSDVTTVGASLEALQHAVVAYAALADTEIIHDHTVVGPFLAERPPPAPIVTTVHGPFTPGMLAVYRAMPPEVSIVAVSHRQAATAEGLTLDRVIHHGIRTGDVPMGSGRGGFACFVGRMHPSKGVREAIAVSREAALPLRIAAKMREQGEREYFDQFISPLLGPDIEYLGELNTRDKYELLGESVALVNPIQWEEPFGMVMIEALAAGTPVITTSRGSAPEIVDDGSTGFFGTDVRSLADALRRVGELDRQRCREAAEDRFSAERMAAEHVRLYSDLIQRQVDGTGDPLYDERLHSR